MSSGDDYYGESAHSYAQRHGYNPDDSYNPSYVRTVGPVSSSSAYGGTHVSTSSWTAGANVSDYYTGSDHNPYAQQQQPQFENLPTRSRAPPPPSPPHHSDHHHHHHHHHHHQPQQQQQQKGKGKEREIVVVDEEEYDYSGTHNSGYPGSDVESVRSDDPRGGVGATSPDPGGYCPYPINDPVFHCGVSLSSGIFDGKGNPLAKTDPVYQLLWRCAQRCVLVFKDYPGRQAHWGRQLLTGWDKHGANHVYGKWDSKRDNYPQLENWIRAIWIPSLQKRFPKIVLEKLGKRVLGRCMVRTTAPKYDAVEKCKVSELVSLHFSPTLLIGRWQAAMERLDYEEAEVLEAKVQITVFHEVGHVFNYCLFGIKSSSNYQLPGEGPPNIGEGGRAAEWFMIGARAVGMLDDPRLMMNRVFKTSWKALDKEPRYQVARGWYNTWLATGEMPSEVEWATTSGGGGALDTTTTGYAGEEEEGYNEDGENGGGIQYTAAQLKVIEEEERKLADALAASRKAADDEDERRWEASQERSRRRSPSEYSEDDGGDGGTRYDAAAAQPQTVGKEERGGREHRGPTQARRKHATKTKTKTKETKSVLGQIMGAVGRGIEQKRREERHDEKEKRSGGHERREPERRDKTTASNSTKGRSRREEDGTDSRRRTGRKDDDREERRGERRDDDAPRYRAKREDEAPRYRDKGEDDAPRYRDKRKDEGPRYRDKGEDDGTKHRGRHSRDADKHRRG